MQPEVTILKSIDGTFIKEYKQYMGISSNTSYKNRYSIIDLSKKKEVLSRDVGYQNVNCTYYDKGLILAQKSNGSWGYLNTKFNEKKWYKDATNFDDTMHAIVSETGTDGYIVDNKLHRVSEIFETQNSICLGNNTFAILQNEKYYLLTIN